MVGNSTWEDFVLQNHNPWTVAVVAVLLLLLTSAASFAAESAKAENSSEPSALASAESNPEPDDIADFDSEITVDLDLNDGQPADTVQGMPDSDNNEPASLRQLLEQSRQQIRQIAVHFIGTPYRWGGTTPNAFDCSGFTRYVYSKMGMRLPRTAREQFKVGKAIKSGNWKTGDLVFFDIKKGYVSHVGLYLGESAFIHASNPRYGVKINSLKEKYYQKFYVGARRPLLT